MRALITGITGQDGSYLAELLLEKGYEVYGLTRNANSEKVNILGHLAGRIALVEGDLTDQQSLNTVLADVCPDEIYNLAAQSFVPVSWEQPLLTSDVTGLGAVRMLEAMRKHAPGAKFLQASSSEMFGTVTESPQSEKTAFRPRSPYGVAKVFAHNITVNYRDNYKLFAGSCICFNHESPRRGAEFVTRKVTQAVANIKLGVMDKLKMGNLEARRDWGFAGDYVRAMWMILQQPAPDDFVIGTGKTHSVQDLLETAFQYCGLDWKKYVEVDPKLVRPPEVNQLCGDASRARKVLGWKPQYTFQQLIEMMVEADLLALKRSAAIRTVPVSV
jgi:GDPmannose 4,6-dehydratase